MVRNEATTAALEQIDGVIELDGNLYLVEVKWSANRIGPGEVAQHMVRVNHRAGMRGLLISASGFTEAAVVLCRDELMRCTFILAELRELVLWLERASSLADALREKVRVALIDRQPLHTVQ